VIASLRCRTWPGNVRELRNAIEHAAIIARGSPLRPEHFPAATGFRAQPREADRLSDAIRDWAREHASSADGTLYDGMLARFEPVLLDEVLRQTGNNRVAAARKLGLARATLRKLIAKYHGVPPGETGETGENGDDGMPDAESATAE
jgi:two-component system, NtrC family, nitrogen regulation response regulator GlnG